MNNPSESSLDAHGSTTVAEIMQVAEEYARQRVSYSRDAVHSEQPSLLARQKLELILTRHFGSTEPFATVSVDGSFVHVAYHAALPNDGVIPLYRAPQMQDEARARGAVVVDDSISSIEIDEASFSVAQVCKALAKPSDHDYVRALERFHQTWLDAQLAQQRVTAASAVVLRA